MSPPCCPCWRPVVRPLPPSAAFLLGGPEPLRGAPRRAPRAPRRRVRPACGGLALGLRLTVTLFPFQEKPDRFSGDAGTGAPTLASVEKEIGGPRLWCLAAAGVPVGMRPQRPSVVLMGRPICPRSTPPNGWLLGVSIGLRPSQRSHTSPRVPKLRGCPTQLSPQSPVAARLPVQGADRENRLPVMSRPRLAQSRRPSGWEAKRGREERACQMAEACYAGLTGPLPGHV